MSIASVIARLFGYNSRSYSAGNPGGFGADGHLRNWEQATDDVAAACQYVGDSAAAVLAAVEDVRAASLSGGGLVVASPTDEGPAGSLATKIEGAEVVNGGGDERVSLAKAMRRAALIFG